MAMTARQYDFPGPEQDLQAPREAVRARKLVEQALPPDSQARARAGGDLGILFASLAVIVAVLLLLWWLTPAQS